MSASSNRIHQTLRRSAEVIPLLIEKSTSPYHGSETTFYVHG
jgi:hypothetical protein